RQDAYANAHRIPVEEDKPASERGYYLHPEAFQQPEEKALEWAQKPDLMRQLKAANTRNVCLRKIKACPGNAGFSVAGLLTIRVVGGIKNGTGAPGRRRSCQTLTRAPRRPLNSQAWDGARIKIRAGSYPETLTLSRPTTLIASGGAVTIGQ